MDGLKTVLEGLKRNAVRLTIGQEDGREVGRFGGLPDVPGDFAWPFFETDTFYDDEVKPRPLSFLAQFDCAALTELDRDGLLPHEGVLSFFYELGSQRWGYDPEDQCCARVYWFPDKAALAPAAFPEEMEADFRLPSLPIWGRSETEYPAYEEFSVDLMDAWRQDGRDPWKVFGEVRKSLRGYEETPPPWHRLLGWPDIIQGCISEECELVSRGYNMGGSQKIPPEVIREAEKSALENWRLLFQLDSGVRAEDFCLDFGDSGSIYFYIKKEDLAARRFDRVWLVLQCC